MCRLCLKLRSGSKICVTMQSVVKIGHTVVEISQFYILKLTTVCHFGLSKFGVTKN